VMSKSIAVILAFFFIGCGTVKASQDGPWAEFIQEENHLTSCESAKMSYDIAIQLDIKFQAMLDDVKVPDEIKTVVRAEQVGIWQLENDLKLWSNTNCKKA
jgi:hypothetical protein